MARDVRSWGEAAALVRCGSAAGVRPHPVMGRAASLRDIEFAQGAVMVGELGVASRVV